MCTAGIRAGTRVSHCSPGSFARLALPIMRDNAGNRLSRFRSRRSLCFSGSATFPNAVTERSPDIQGVPTVLSGRLSARFNAVTSGQRRPGADISIAAGMYSPKTDCSKAWLSILSWTLSLWMHLFYIKKRDGKTAGVRCFLSFKTVGMIILQIIAIAFRFRGFNCN